MIGWIRIYPDFWTLAVDVFNVSSFLLLSWEHFYYRESPDVALRRYCAYFLEQLVCQKLWYGGCFWFPFMEFPLPLPFFHLKAYHVCVSSVKLAS